MFERVPQDMSMPIPSTKMIMHESPTRSLNFDAPKPHRGARFGMVATLTSPPVTGNPPLLSQGFSPVIMPQQHDPILQPYPPHIEPALPHLNFL